MTRQCKRYVPGPTPGSTHNKEVLMKITKGKTGRGFDILSFKDRYGVQCNIQKSSLAEEDAIWFGVEDADPRIMAKDTPEGGVGWVKYSIPDTVLLLTRMHLTREQVADLIPVLQKFVDTGNIK